MALFYRNARARLVRSGLWPNTKIAYAACYLLAIDALAFVLQKTLSLSKSSYADSLSGWVAFFSFVASILLAILAYRWSKTKLLWRLRNRLIVTYVFIGVIPAVLL